MYRLIPGLETEIQTAGVSVQVADATMGVKGGLIVNPLDATDQGIAVAESLFVNLLGSATVSSQYGTVELVPGQWFLVPPQSNVWATAQTAGHKFTAFFSSPFHPSYPPMVVPGQPEGPITFGSDEGAIGSEAGTPPFPPPGVTGLTTVIPSYLYQQYTDDDDLQGFVDSQNILQQDYVDTFNALNLPIYTGPIVAGALLDWVGRGVYGMARPALGQNRLNIFGPLNTFGANWIAPMWFQYTASMEVEFGFNEIGFYGPQQVYLTNDDIYRRVLTWHFYKGDGNYWSTRFLKRRIWRFLYGVDGKAPEQVDWWPNDNWIADTEQISVTLGVNRNVTIRFILGKRSVNLPAGGAMCNGFGYNGIEPAWGIPRAWDIGVDKSVGPTGTPKPAGIILNDLETTRIEYPDLPMMGTFKQAVDLGVLELPYQYNFTCVIG